jgi:hypothetical protein
MAAKARCLLMIPLIGVLASGCLGGKSANATASVSGTVTYNGNPVKGGKVTFHRQGAAVSAASIRKDGTYSETGLPPEEMTLTVETESVNPNKKGPVYGGGRYKTEQYKPPPDVNVPDLSPENYVKIPGKYADPKTSPLKVTLSGGKQTHNIELTD